MQVARENLAAAAGAGAPAALQPRHIREPGVAAAALQPLSDDRAALLGVECDPCGAPGAGEASCVDSTLAQLSEQQQRRTPLSRRPSRMAGGAGTPGRAVRALSFSGGGGGGGSGVAHVAGGAGSIAAAVAMAATPVAPPADDYDC